MSQSTKRANPRVNTSVQRNNFSLGSSVRNSTLLLANSSYMNKGISGPLVKGCHLRLNSSFSGRLHEKRGVGTYVKVMSEA